VDEIVIADARDPVGLSAKVQAAGGPADVTVVCVDVPGCEGGAILSAKQGGTVIFFSMTTSFSAAALSAEGVAADVTMLIGNGYVPGHADLALDLVRSVPSVRKLFEQRLGSEPERLGAAWTEEHPREPKGAAPPGQRLLPQTHPRGDGGATREGGASRAPGGERGKHSDEGRRRQ
jgi:hypothetical protein